MKPIVIPPRKNYPAVGRCIYCGAHGPTVTLRDEHIVSLALGGNLVLPKASCRKCEGATSYIEGACARGVFSEARIHLGLKGRRPKSRPQFLKAVQGRPWEKREIALLPSVHPLYLAMPVFKRAGILTGANPTSEFADVELYVPVTQHSLQRHADLPRDTGIPLTYHPLALCRMLAKIAHSFAIADLGQEFELFQPLLPDLILAKDLRAPFLVGGAPTWPPPLGQPRESNALHTLQMATLKENDPVWLVCHVQLFAFLGA